MQAQPRRRVQMQAALHGHLAAQWQLYRKEHEHELPNRGTPGSREERTYQRAVLKLLRSFTREIGNSLL